MRNGQGTYTFAKGQKYVGEWKDGKRNGKGTFTISKDDKKSKNLRYVGQWKGGKRHGQGTTYYRNGDKYVGGWKNNSFHGQGTFIRSYGVVQKITADRGAWRLWAPEIDGKWHGNRQ